ncbi:MAG: ABC transporter permease [Gammaproteobacteria bacterium]|nr:ABC transporter permease [Gammaproteobacteria bacterium]
MTSAFFIQLRRELGAIYNSPMAYVIFFCFSLIVGTIFYTNFQGLELNPRATALNMFFSNWWYWICMFVMIPLITMRVFSEEYKTGTIELLLTAPLSDWDVVLSKFFASLTFYLMLWTPVLVYLGLFQWVTDSQIPFKLEETMLCCLIVILIGSFFVSIGVFTSSLTRNQVLAAFLSFCTVLSVFLLGLLTARTPDSKFTPAVEYLSSVQHVYYYLNGIFDSRPIVFYLSGTALFLALTQQVMAANKLKS